MATDKVKDNGGSAASLQDALIVQGMSQWMVLVHVSFEIGIRDLELPKKSSERNDLLKLAFDVRAEADRLFATTRVHR